MPVLGAVLVAAVRYVVGLLFETHVVDQAFCIVFLHGQDDFLAFFRQLEVGVQAWSGALGIVGPNEKVTLGWDRGPRRERPLAEILFGITEAHAGEVDLQVAGIEQFDPICGHGAGTGCRFAAGCEEFVDHDGRVRRFAGKHRFRWGSLLWLRQSGGDLGGQCGERRVSREELTALFGESAQAHGLAILAERIVRGLDLGTSDRAWPQRYRHGFWPGVRAGHADRGAGAGTCTPAPMSAPPSAGYANGYKSKRIDTPAGTVTSTFPRPPAMMARRSTPSRWSAAADRCAP